MKRIAFIFIAMFCFLAAKSDTPQDIYIARYADMAVSEMYRSGVPASITLAQGLLESGYGLSELATKGNNHFGIKCHRDWTGRSMKYDDDARGECFRVYPSVADSYADHSDFLRYKDRYKFLFDYKTSDYKAWCHGLKKAGYATDPGYASKLIKLIEDYRLYEYDTMKPTDFKKVQKEVSEEKTKVSGKTSSKSSRKTRMSGRKAKKFPNGKPDPEVVEDEPEDEETPDSPEEYVIPESPLKLEQSEKYEPVRGEFSFTLSRPVYTKNGVPFVYSVEGDSYASLARNYDLFKKEILKFNDLESSRPLNPGTVVYIQAKKNKSRKGLDMHIVDSPDETLRDISQRYAVKMSSLMKLNGITSDNYTLAEGDRILLR